MNRRSYRNTVLALTAVTVLSLTGCVVEPPHQHVEHVQPRIVQAPPAPLVEIIPSAPSPDAYWVGGHWKWEGNRYVWNNGHWEQSRQGQVYQQSYWTQNGDAFVFHQGHWVNIQPSYNAAPIVINVAPPPPRIEIISAAPSPNHVWIGGYWRWNNNNGRHEWVNGHWEQRRDGQFWAPGHWVRNGNSWSFSGGFWQHY